MGLKKPQVLDDVSFHHSVDFRVTKGDIIDMVVSEKRDAIDEELDALETELVSCKKKREELFNSYVKSVQAKVTKETAASMKALSKFYDMELEFDSCLAELKVDYCFLMKDKAGKKGYRNRERSPEIYLELGDVSVKETKELQKLNKKVAELQEAVNDLETERNELGAKGKKVMGNLVRQLLERSEEGRKILGTLPKLAAAEMQNLLG